MEQRIEFKQGWNLIAFQVLPSDPNAESVFAADEFSSVWTYDNLSGAWHFYGRNDSQVPALVDQNRIIPLNQIELGKAYWIYYEGGAAQVLEIEGAVSMGGFQLDFKQGWNLVGIPAGPVDADVNIVSVFRPGDLGKIELIVRWEVENQTFQSYDPDNPTASEFQSFNPGLGHWIKLTEELSLQPEMVFEALGDADLLPLSSVQPVNGIEWNPGPEDIDYGLPGQNPIFNDRTTQTVIVIPKGQPSVSLPLYNKGGGLFAWSATIQSRSSMGGAIGLSEEEASQILSLEAATGITSSETDVVTVEVDRAFLAPGKYLARLVVQASTGQERIFDLVIEVGGLDGEWHGTAFIDSVNGRSNPVADIDLVLQLFQDRKVGSMQLRGLIDSQETLLWPVDAPVLGHLTGGSANGSYFGQPAQFVISGGYTLPPGDVNRPPFEDFPDAQSPQQIDQTTGLSFRTNSEGDRWYFTLPGRESGPDFLNPIPRFISREVELIGQVTGSDGGRMTAEGEYYETIRGLTANPIELIGTFQISRNKYSPLERRPYKYFDEFIPFAGISVGGGETKSRTIPVSDHILIHRVVVVTAQNAPGDKHELWITSPSGNRVLLHQAQNAGSTLSSIFDSGELPLDPLTLLEPPDLRGANAPPQDQGTLLRERYLRDSLANYSVRKPRESLEVFKDEDSSGDWVLEYTNKDGGSSHNLLGWSLLFYGVPAYPLEGQVVVEGNDHPNRFQDVSIQLLGLNADLDDGLTEFDRTTGRFTVQCIPGVRVNVAAFKPGYPMATIEGLNSSIDPRGFRDHLGGIVAGGPDTGDLQLVLRLPEQTTPGEVLAHRRVYDLNSVGGVVALKEAGFTYEGSVPDSDIAWELIWGKSGSDPAPVAWSESGRRFVLVDLQIPASEFSENNRHTLAFRARAYRISTEETLAVSDWVTVVLRNPTPPPEPSPFWNVTLVQGSVLQGFGAVPQSITHNVDDSGKTALHAQKTDVAKVDIDRPPLIDDTNNPNFLFAEDGFGDASGDGEDTDLHPRNFTLHASGDNQNLYGYAEILDIPDARFTPLIAPLEGQLPDYNDIDKGISGLDINLPNQPVRLFTAIGGRVINLGVSGSNGSMRVSAGANPGIDLERP